MVVAYHQIVARVGATEAVSHTLQIRSAHTRHILHTGGNAPAVVETRLIHHVAIFIRQARERGLAPLLHREVDLGRKTLVEVVVQTEGISVWLAVAHCLQTLIGDGVGFCRPRGRRHVARHIIFHAPCASVEIFLR